MWQDAVLTINDSTTYAGQLNDRWRNGWACPRFTREVAETIARDVTKPLVHGGQELPASYRAWRWSGDVLELETNPEVMDPHTERFGPDTDGMYHVGSGSWIWDEVTS